MNRSQYIRLVKEIDVSPHPFSTLIVLGIDVALAFSASLMVRKDSWFFFILSQVMLAIVLFHGFAIMHEAGHYNIFKSKFMNNIIGHIASIFSFYPFFSWVNFHDAHHKYTGNIERDPTSGLIRRYRSGKISKTEKAIFDMLWKSHIPILAVLQTSMFWLSPFAEFFNKTARSNRNNNLKAIASVVILGSIYAIIFSMTNLVFTFFPAIVLYFIFIEIINYPHHLGLGFSDNLNHKATPTPVWQQNLYTRTTKYAEVFSKFFILNFNHHTVHHLFPKLPWMQLPAVSNVVSQVSPDFVSEYHGISWYFVGRSTDLEKLLLAGDIKESEDFGEKYRVSDPPP